MKHSLRGSFLGAVVVTSVFTASAAIIEVGTSTGTSFRFINSRFTMGNEVALYSEVEYDRVFEIFDKTLKPVRTISIPEYPEVKATKIVEEGIRGPIGISQSDRYEEPTWLDISSEEMDNVAASNGYKLRSQSGNTIIYMTDNLWDYYYGEIYGLKYPARWIEWNSETRNGIMVSVEYTYEDWGSTGLYGEPQTEIESVRPTILETELKSADCGDMEDIPLTQTLFNDDEAFEWIIPVISAVDISLTTLDRKETGQSLVSTGFMVKSEDGSTVATVAFPSGLYGYIYDSPELLIIDNRYYLVVAVFTADYSENYSLIYEISRESGLIDMVGEPLPVKVHPTAPVRGATVDVEIGATTGNRLVLGVVGSDGRTVMRRNLEPGTTHTSIDTGRLGRGVYVVTVTDGAGTRNATKIVVR